MSTTGLTARFIAGVPLAGGFPETSVAASDEIEDDELEQNRSRSRRLATLGGMASGIAHDFNTCLTIIKGRAQFLLAGLPEGSPVRRDAEHINETVERASRLVGQLLEFSRQQPAEARAVNLTGLVAGLAPILQMALGGAAELRLWLAPDLWAVWVDPGEVEQVLMNLIGNARDAVAEAGSGPALLTIETANIEVDGASPPGREGSLVPGPYVMLAVRDTGCGMTSEVCARIFQPFFSTKQPGKGTGLGLALVREVVEEYGGHVRCESEPGRGAAFCIYLPRDQQGRRETAEPARPAGRDDEAPPASPTAAGAENDDAAGQVIRQASSRYGCIARVAGGFASAPAAPAASGSIDLLLTELSVQAGAGRVSPGRRNTGE